MTTRAFPLLVLSVGLAIPASGQDAPRKITIKPKVGEVANYRSTQTQHQVMEAMGQDSTNEIVTELQVTVDEVASDGTVKASATWLRFRGKLQAMGGETEFDTKKPGESGDNPMLEGFADGCAAVIGTKTSLTFGPTGKLVDKKPLEDLAAKMAEKVAGPAKMMLQGIFGAHVLEDQASVFGSFPAEPVAVGGTWSEKRDRKGRGGLDMVTEVTSKLVTANDDVYETKVTGTLVSAPAKTDDKAKDDDDDDDDQANMMRQMMRDAKVKDGKVEGTTKVSRKDGLLIQAESTTSMSIHMPNPMGGDEPFVVSVKQNQKLERVAAEPAKEAPAAPKK